MKKFKLLGENNYFSKNPIEEILLNRGVCSSVLNTENEDIPSPLEFTNMQEGVDLLVDMLENNKKIAIIMDSDPDGVSSTAIIHNRIKHSFPKVKVNIIYHEKRVHGIFLNEIEKIGYENIDLLIVPDGGSDNYKEHKILKDNGIKVLIIDHHDVEIRSKDALVINNKIDNKYPNICGAYLTWLFCKQLDEELWEDGVSDNFLDLAMFGTISDMMDIGNNYCQHIIQKGFENIKNSGLKAIVDAQSFTIGSELTPKSISFSVTPLVNSVFRLGTNENKENIIKSFCELDNSTYIYVPKRGKDKGIEKEESIHEKMARECVSLNGKRQRLGKKILKETIVDYENKILLVEIDKKYGEDGMTRIICNNISKKNQKPCLCYYKNKNNKYKGSMASGGVVENFLNKLKEMDIFEFVAGHQDAAGFELKEIELQNAQEKLNKKFEDYVFEKVEVVDFNIEYQDFLNYGEYLIGDLGYYNNIYGIGLDTPKIRIYNMEVKPENIELIGKAKNTLKITIPDQNLVLIKFFTNKEFYEDLTNFKDVVKLNIIGECNVNEYKNKRTYQIFISDMEEIKKEEDELDLDFGDEW